MLNYQGTLITIRPLIMAELINLSPIENSAKNGILRTFNEKSNPSSQHPFCG
jgi:hypothetical protein